MKHYNQTPKRKAEFINPPNRIKEKVGSGGISDDILEKAQALLENNTVDFEPLAVMYLNALMAGIEKSKDSDPADDKEYLISTMLYPAMQLKANGGMFHFPLISEIADRLIQFLEVINEPDLESIEIVLAFHTTMRAIIHGKIMGNGGDHGRDLLKALNKACVRYFEKPVS
ncbi:MAG: hypothetical protein GW778_00060 [Alphaproteobacteria bacterium]|nr:hypothetical protein [Alphaproteobacteria bacterium]